MTNFDYRPHRGNPDTIRRIDESFATGTLRRHPPAPTSALAPKPKTRARRFIQWIEADTRRFFWTLAFLVGALLLLIDAGFGWLTGT
jgi:hypothetical protein